MYKNQFTKTMFNSFSKVKFIIQSIIGSYYIFNKFMLRYS